MTPQEEQAAMQAFVRQRLAAQGQLNLTPGQVPLASEDQGQFMQRPPIAPDVALSATPGAAGFSNNAAPDATRGTGLGVSENIAPAPYGGEEPGAFGMQGGIAPRRLRDVRGLLNSRFMLQQKVPF